MILTKETSGMKKFEESKKLELEMFMLLESLCLKGVWVVVQYRSLCTKKVAKPFVEMILTLLRSFKINLAMTTL